MCVVDGVVVAIAVSIGVFFYRPARPHDAVPCQDEDVDGFRDIVRWDGAETFPRLLVYALASRRPASPPES